MWAPTAVLLACFLFALGGLLLYDYTLRRLPSDILLDIVLNDRYPWRSLVIVGPLVFYFKVKRFFPSKLLEK